MHDISLSVFFPCYNEELNIEGLILEAIQVLDRSVREYEILVINDGSTDRTVLIADRLIEEHEHVRVIHHSNNRGYGAALISGFSNSIHEWVFFTDGDRQFLISEIELLLNHIDDHDLIIGFREARRDPWHRILYGHLWTRLVQLLFDIEVRDINCAFKLVRKTTLDSITLHSSGALISTELLVRATFSGASIRQMGVSHRPRMFGRQTGGNPQVILKAFMELFKLRRELAGRQLRSAK
ncbi:MAG: glycosyltransferase family 2 protein [Deltaproteobacteria bacterium]|nr:glycosyltransferase family 2 protein [Deltaproteobacteria bacterium]